MENPSMSATPKLSIIVIFYNMRREARRTLHTLSARYQQNVSKSDYQVVVIDNGSDLPLDSEFVCSFGENFEYHYFETDSPSPAAAVNYGVRQAKNEYISCVVDGARMLSPGIVYFTLKACAISDHPFVAALAWHLGPKEQNLSVLDGYDQIEEDLLLQSFDWENDGYCLFDNCALASSSDVGFLRGLPQECSYFSILKTAFLELGGFDERFQSPGGGLINHDFLQRVVGSKIFDLTVLLGEGTFHQFHGGVATNSTPEKHPWLSFADEYKKVRGVVFSDLIQPPVTKLKYVGCMPSSALKYINSPAP